MTDTLIAILSIIIGIIGANTVSVVRKKFNMGFTGNTIAGIFGSIFFIKIFGRLGFDPVSIMESGMVNNILFSINMIISLIGGAVGLIAIKWMRYKLNRTRH